MNLLLLLIILIIIGSTSGYYFKPIWYTPTINTVFSVILIVLILRLAGLA